LFLLCILLIKIFKYCKNHLGIYKFKKVVCSPWQAMRVLGMEFGYRIPVMPIGGNQRINWRKNKSLSVVFGLFAFLKGGRRGKIKEY
jgi:hypothetical protein